MNHYRQTRQTCRLGKGQAEICFTGYHYPKCEWSMLTRHSEPLNLDAIDIGCLSLQAEGVNSVNEVAQLLLSIASAYGAHLVKIDRLNHRQASGTNARTQGYTVKIDAHLQRIAL